MISLVPLGETGIQVSRVGLGTVKFGRNQGVNYPKKFSLPSDHEINELLNCAQTLGINLLDTAPAYGLSEERIGRIIKQDRSSWILCTKVGEEFCDGKSRFDFSASAIRQSIERSLKRLNTDILDIVLVHSSGEDKKIIEEDAVFSTLADIKKTGYIRAFGMSTKTIEGGMLAVDHSDVVMVTYNPIHQEERVVIDYANQKNKGIFIKKSLVSGNLDKISSEDPVLSAMRFVFAAEGISSVIFGTLNKEHLIHNVKCVGKALS